MNPVNRPEIPDPPADSFRHCRSRQEAFGDPLHSSISARDKLRSSLKLPALPGSCSRPRAQRAPPEQGFLFRRLPARPTLKYFNFKNLFGILLIFFHNLCPEIMLFSLSDLWNWVRLFIPSGSAFQGQPGFTTLPPGSEGSQGSSAGKRPAASPKQSMTRLRAFHWLTPAPAAHFCDPSTGSGSGIALSEET